MKQDLVERLRLRGMNDEADEVRKIQDKLTIALSVLSIIKSEADNLSNTVELAFSNIKGVDEYYE